MFVDTHAHLYFEKYDEDRDFLIRSFTENSVEAVITIGTDPINSRECIKLAEKYHNIYASVGYHPTDLGDLKESDLNDLRSMINHEKVVAIGEAGLDYYWDNVPREKQKKFFIKQLELSLEENIPIIIHNRDADSDMMEIIENISPVYSGVFHCYAGDLKMAEKLIERGFYISFTGNITYKKSDRSEIIEKLPLNKLLLETDSPFMTPVPFRGKRNDPNFIKYVAEKIASIKQISLDEVAFHTTENAKRLFNLNK
ncbi:MAG: TatD family hydrolase [Candidatus Delongbacteria bacterium]|nr:TatD family hydrolase [Candidatus Delongbacteria bacterium]MBN2835886.1 TatD family hydrolase [Candidatus Delongbacteria bacterium]